MHWTLEPEDVERKSQLFLGKIYNDFYLQYISRPIQQ